MTETKCSHDPNSKVQSCAIFHECKGCRGRFMGFFRDGYCLSCYPVYAAGRSDLARKILDTVDAQRFTGIDHCCDKTITEVAVPALERLLEQEGVAVGEKRST